MKPFLLTIVISFTLLSCEKPDPCDDPKIDCSNIRCFAFWSYFEFKLVDRITGADLVFGTNPKYSINDVKLFADAAKTIPLNLTKDDSKKWLQTMTARAEMFLEIKGIDTYKLTAEFRANDCCSNHVKSLVIDGFVICTCCTEVIPIPVS
jgi:hypothetical protein